MLNSGERNSTAESEHRSILRPASVKLSNMGVTKLSKVVDLTEELASGRKL